ncbi:uncharacterized protein LOC119004299 [Acanthopagrus latus]|uniref:uncharacterized protein LOC119004299 n=1 Tax=Acanthopagrus latus TaxID=8177 RepID=UPI00187C27F9|nr:uncharacterized protein LOC119004299 [Acanthopagrus latus]
MGRGVSRTTVWRLKKKQEEMLTSVTIGGAAGDEPDSGSDEDQLGEDGETLEDRGVPRPIIWRVQTSSEGQHRVLVKEEPGQEPLTPESRSGGAGPVTASCQIHVPPRVKDDPDQPEPSQPSTWSRPDLEVHQPPATTETLSSRQEPRATMWRVQTSSESQQRVLVKEEPRQEPLTPENQLASCVQSVPRVKDESDSDQTETSEPGTSPPPCQEDYQTSSSGSSGSSCSTCPHCGDSVQNLRHFVYRDLVFCEEAADEGETLEKWLKERGVPKTTVWRIKKKQEVLLVGGSLPRRKDRVCLQCGERKTKANGHTILRAVRETFCSRTDPLGRTVEQWLTEKRGGVTTEQLKELDRAVRNARAKEKRARILGRLPAKQPAVMRGTFQTDATANGPRTRRRDGGAAQSRLLLRKSQKKREFPDYYVYT